MYGVLTVVLIALYLLGGMTVLDACASPGGKTTAKVASDRAKPDGLLEVPPSGDAAFLAPLPVSHCDTPRSLSPFDVRSVDDAWRADHAESSPRRVRW